VKQRLLVMNGQCLLQEERIAGWMTLKVGHAGDIKPGFYLLTNAVAANPDDVSIGVILHVNREAIYQQVGLTIVKHHRSAFKNTPRAGMIKKITYDYSGFAQVRKAKQVLIKSAKTGA